jgi:hypothetical protein
MRVIDKFFLGQDLNLRDDFDREIVFDVVVEEEKTKRRQNNTNSIMVYKHPYKIELGTNIPPTIMNI